MTFRYRLRFLSRKQGDYARHLRAARLAQTTGEIGCESYHTGRIDNLAVLVENESDIDAVLAALPADAFYGAQNLDDDSLLDLAPEGRRGRV